jgi:CsoR family transcriptional regulator, copper-sensing transcriptional repressor
MTPRKSPAIPKALVAACACQTGRKAAAVDPKIKATVLARLARIEGQVRGLRNMVESERYCTDILLQISSVQEALRGASRQLMRNHLEHCASDAIRKGSPTADAMYEELLDLVYRHAR